MTRINKNKKGFTLIEIILVVSIVVIVSAATFVGVAVTLGRAQNNGNFIRDHKGDNFELVARQQVKELTHGANHIAVPQIYTPEDEDTNDNPAPDNNDDDDNNGPVVNDDTVNDDDTVIDDNDDGDDDDDDDDLNDDEENEVIEDNNDEEGNGEVVSVPGGYVANEWNQPHGVVGVVDPPVVNGNTTTLYVTGDNGYNRIEISITKNGDEYVINMGQLIYNIGNIPFPGYVNNQTTYTLDDAQKKWLKDNYGIVLS